MTWDLKRYSKRLLGRKTTKPQVHVEGRVNTDYPRLNGVWVTFNGNVVVFDGVPDHPEESVTAFKALFDLFPDDSLYDFFRLPMRDYLHNAPRIQNMEGTRWMSTSDVVQEVREGTMEPLALAVFILAKIKATRDDLLKMTENVRINITESKVPVDILHRLPAAFVYPSWAMGFDSEGPRGKNPAFGFSTEFIDISEDFAYRVRRAFGAKSGKSKFGNALTTTVNNYLASYKMISRMRYMWSLVENDEELRLKLFRLNDEDAANYLQAVSLIDGDMHAARLLMEYFSSNDVEIKNYYAMTIHVGSLSTSRRPSTPQKRFSHVFFNTEEIFGDWLVPFIVEHEAGVPLSEASVELLRTKSMDLKPGERIPFACAVIEELKRDSTVPVDWLVHYVDVPPSIFRGIDKDLLRSLPRLRLGG